MIAPVGGSLCRHAVPPRRADAARRRLLRVGAPRLASVQFVTSRTSPPYDIDWSGRADWPASPQAIEHGPRDWEAVRAGRRADRGYRGARDRRGAVARRDRRRDRPAPHAARRSRASTRAWSASTASCGRGGSPGSIAGGGGHERRALDAAARRSRSRAMRSAPRPSPWRCRTARPSTRSSWPRVSPRGPRCASGWTSGKSPRSTGASPARAPAAGS